MYQYNLKNNKFYCKGDLVLTIEEYIAHRKKEDKLNEFNMAEEMKNTRICVNYVFDYFNTYLAADESFNDSFNELLDEPPVEQQALDVEKLKKYRSQLPEYDNTIVEWLVQKIKHK